MFQDSKHQDHGKLFLKCRDSLFDVFTEELELRKVFRVLPDNRIEHIQADVGPDLGNELQYSGSSTSDVEDIGVAGNEAYRVKDPLTFEQRREEADNLPLFLTHRAPPKTS